MTVLTWPADLVPYRVGFYLQPHVGGAESPLTRTRKLYGLSAPRWVARLSFRGGVSGVPLTGSAEGFGPRLDALIADLQGGLVKAAFHDFRRPLPTRTLATTGVLRLASAAVVGATSVAVSGFAPFGPALAVGDYLGGVHSGWDGRPHQVSEVATRAAGGTVAGAGTVMANADGVAIIGFRPPLSAAVSAGTVLDWPVRGVFELTGEDAGQNETEVGEAVDYALDFVEDLT